MELNLKCSECGGDVAKVPGNEFVCQKCGRKISFANSKKRIIDMDKYKDYNQVIFG